MRITIEIIGSFILTAVMMAIPILCGISFALGWNDYIQWLLTIGTVGLFLSLWIKILDIAD